MDVSKLHPREDLVLVEVIPTTETMSDSGLVVIEDDRTKNSRRIEKGRVLAVGPGRRESGSVVPMQVRVGDVALFGAYAGTDVSDLGGPERFLVREIEIEAVER